MGADTAIEWCDHTFNPWLGCTKVSPACDHCYAEGWAKRTGQAALWQGERRRTSAANWRQPLRWNQVAKALGVRRRVFCASLADVFDNQVPEEWREDLWRLIIDTPHLDWLLLTKRPQMIARFLPNAWGRDGLPNVWLGTTVENQEEAERRIPNLLAVPARLRFLSCEPLLGPVKFYPPWISTSGGWRHEARIGWVIAGGESGRGARPPRIEWVRSLRDQCAEARVPFFFKQWGEFTPDDPGGGPTSMRRVGKARAGALIDGREHRAFPHG